MDKNVAVIGAGPAGLAAAALLVNKNYKVTVYEATSTYGGKLGLLKLDDSLFDTGPSLLTEPNVLDSIYKICGKDPKKYWQYKKLKQGTKYFWDDGLNYQMPAEYSKLGYSIEHNFQVMPLKLQKYLKNLEYQYIKAASQFLDKRFRLLDLNNLKQFRIFRKTLPYLLTTAHKQNNKYFSDKKVVQIFDRFATYSGSNPYSGPALLNVAGAPEIIDGVYYPKGGMRSIVNGYYKLALDLGVKFKFNNAVEKIDMNGALFKVKSNNSWQQFGKIIYAGDYANLYKLLGDSYSFKNYSRQRSTSGLVFYWQVKGSYGQLGLHNILFSSNYKNEFGCLKDGKLVSDPTIYINITSKIEPSLAKKGHENWFVMLNVPANYKPKDHSMLQSQIINRVQKVIGKNIEITASDYLDPAKIEQTSLSYRGAIYGHDSNSIKSAVIKPKNQLRSYPGLYCIGGSVHPGGGVPLSVRSAKIVAEQL